MKDKIAKLLQRLVEVENELGKPEAINDQKQFRFLTQEHAYISQVREVWESLLDLTNQLKDNRDLLKEDQDEDLKKMLLDDIASLEEKTPVLEKKLENLLIPPDPNDHRNTIMELRAGTGGDEAALFVGDCVRMYKCYADAVGWRYELLSCTSAEVGGYKEYVMVLSGPNVYRYMKHEGGTHRVQRVPTTESQGRVHTSAITIAVLMEPDEEEEIVLNDKDLRIDTYRASGAGGQHINTTDSAVRITHVPTGLVSYCMQEKSQHKNKEKALRLLHAKIADHERIKKEKEIIGLRSQQVGSGDRSERIRTYNFSQNRVTDHRINVTLYSLDKIMNGDLEGLITAVVSHYHQKKLAD